MDADKIPLHRLITFKNFRSQRNSVLDYRVSLLLITLCGASLRWRGVFHNSFFADEALYAFWARSIYSGRDRFLTDLLVDKPPLTFLFQAISFGLFEPHEWSARLPNTIASILLIPLIAHLASLLWVNRWCGILAAIVVALSPYAIQFSGSAYTDPLYVTLATASLLLSFRNRWLLSGVLFGLALTAKYHAVFFLPLFLLSPPDVGTRLAVSLRRGMRLWGMGCGSVVGLLVCWWLVAQFDGGWRSGGDVVLLTSLRPSYLWEIMPRLREWYRVSGFFMGVWGWLLFILVSFGLLWRGSRRSVGLFLYLLGYILLFWLSSIPTHDRYYFPVLIMVALGVARLGMGTAWRGTAWDTASRVPTVVLVVVMVWGAWGARGGMYDVGATTRADDGAAELAVLLDDEPYGTVLYDHWYSWQWRYHLFDSRVYMLWIPSPEVLVEDLDQFWDEEDARYFVYKWDMGAEYVRALESAGYDLVTIDQRSGDQAMVLVKIERNE